MTSQTIFHCWRLFPVYVAIRKRDKIEEINFLKVKRSQKIESGTEKISGFTYADASDLKLWNANILFRKFW